MEQLTKNQAVATSQEAVQNQNEPQLRDENAHNDKSVHGVRSEERFSRNAETDLVCRLLLEKKKKADRDRCDIYSDEVNPTIRYSAAHDDASSVSSCPQLSLSTH